MSSRNFLTLDKAKLLRHSFLSLILQHHIHNPRDQALKFLLGSLNSQLVPLAYLQPSKHSTTQPSKEYCWLIKERNKTTQKY